MSQILKKIKENKKFEYILFNSIPIKIKDQLTNDIDIDQLIDTIENTLPPPPKNLIKQISVENNPIFKQREVNALYNNGILYISNDQDDLNDMLDDIVHEYSHALEEIYGEEIYSDASIKDEFLSKRQQLELILRHGGFDTHNYDFKENKFNKELDNFLLNVVGYDRFKKLTNYGLFINPYAATSLREYFATGFEEYILGDHRELQNISPSLYNKLRELF